MPGAGGDESDALAEVTDSESDPVDLVSKLEPIEVVWTGCPATVSV